MTMQKMIHAVALSVLTLGAAGASAEVTRDCILEGTVDKQKAKAAGKDVYVAFHSATSGKQADCNMNRRNRLEFKEPKNAMIENVPHGSTVKYRYTEEDNQKGEWQLMDISMQ